MQEHRLFDGRLLFLGRLAPELDQIARAQFAELWDLHPHKFPQITLHGRSIRLPRWQQAYGRSYRYAGGVRRALPVPGILRPFLAWAREAVDARLNGLLLNWYDAARGHYIGAHRDSTAGLIGATPIVTISVGASRAFRLRPAAGRGFADFEATHGSVFVMPWNTNLAVKHEVPHRKDSIGRRISITVRAFACSQP